MLVAVTHYFACRRSSKQERGFFAARYLEAETNCMEQYTIATGAYSRFLLCKCEGHLTKLKGGLGLGHARKNNELIT